MCADLDIENYAMLYTSKIIKKKLATKNEETEILRRELLDEIINELGRLHEEAEGQDEQWDLMIVDVNKNYDLMLGFKKIETATNLATEGKITIETKPYGHVIIPVGPMVPQGAINYKRYFVKTAVTPGIPQAYIAAELGRRYKLREVEVPNMKRGDT